MAPPQVNRLRDKGLVDRKKVVGFNFDGTRLTGHPGDTLASALLANGVRLVARSFKYHRPRGILTAGSEEPNALVELRTNARREPNTRATTVELYDGLNAASQNRWPSLKYDLLSVNQLASPIFGAGFYYKTFMWPASFWEKVYEPMIRRAAGLGRAASAADPDHYEKSNAFCDVLVIGGGAAGLSAALSAAKAGARVILCDEDFRLGGRLLAERDQIDGRPAHEWVAAAEAELESLPDCRILRRTSVFASMTAAPTPRSSGSTIICPCRRRMSRASACGASWPSVPFCAPAPSSGPSFLATTTAPASCWRAPCALT
ncbi:hypothetical protein AUC71_10985 [Methyloceanibacter marginalis]|uniref:FAD/NAD(P)-binding domain-containing protein n=1 Tax=Methyloceanibacter marginalis TaxID=1774971 RepID=A0A1E3WBK0_9HYPH|nr:hypothetical protein AUC71_10985 [Methyloceanibacter marginalis]